MYPYCRVKVPFFLKLGLLLIPSLPRPRFIWPLAIGLRLPGSSLLKLPHHSGRSPAARAPGPKWASLSIRQIACSLTTVTEVARLTSPTLQLLDASWWYSLTLLENLCLHSETVWKFWWVVLRFSGWVGQTVSEYRRLGDRQLQIFWTYIHPCGEQCNGQRSLNELGAVTLILLHICSMISFGGSLEECLPCLLWYCMVFVMVLHGIGYGIAWYCKSLLCSMFNEQTLGSPGCCLSSSSPCPEYLKKPYNCFIVQVKLSLVRVLNSK